MPRKPISFRQRGISLPAVLLFTVSTGMVAASVFSLTRVAHKHASRSAEKMQSTLLAEGAIAEHFDAIRKEMHATKTYPIDIAESEKEGLVHGNTVNLGWASSKVIKVDESHEDIEDGVYIIRTYNYVFTLEGRGRTNSSISSIVRSTFTATMKEVYKPDEGGSSSTGPTETFGFPIGAIVANNEVKFKTNAGLRTYAPDGLSGHVLGNKGIRWDTKSGGKAGQTNPNVMDIQGQYLVGPTYRGMTISDAGIGNANGSKNYRNPAAPASGGFAGGPTDDVLEMPGEAYFAPASTINAYGTDWQATSKGAGSTQLSGNQDTSTVPKDSTTGKATITTPAFIDGDLTVTGGTLLRVRPGSSNPSNNVLFVKGDVKNLGLFENLGVTIVILGKYSDSGASEYRLSTQDSIYSTLSKVSEKAALISLAEDAQAFKFDTNSTARTGLIYAAKGGIKITGNPEFTGMLLAGGTGSKGDIDIDPANDESFVVHFDPDAGNPGDAMGTGEVEYEFYYTYQSFWPTELNQWVWLK